ncbi:MAG TPA: hypothetical protein VG676_08235, partial [Chitinophagaceae bacterium]|nr:hypothetical protein [Chitinophagaceae bacterium]
MLKNILSGLFSIMFSAGFLNGQVIQTGNTNQNSTVDYRRLTIIDSVLNDYVHKHWITGAVTLVVKDDQLIQYKGYGYADEE